MSLTAPSSARHHDPALERSVLSALGIERTEITALPPFDPIIEVSPTTPPRGSRGRYLRAAEVDARLQPFVADARAGVPDRMLAQRAGLTIERVRQWRRRHRIAGRRGRPTAAQGRAYLVAPLLGEHAPPLMHDVASPVGGTWRPPAYVLRQPLDYALFAACVVRLVDDFTTTQIATAIGIAERDVFDAVVLHEARGGAA